jgi:tetratricopeptide (TPR) repeat protein
MAAYSGFLAGYHEESMALNEQAHSEAKAAGYENIEEYTRVVRGIMYQRTGRYAEAQELLDKAAQSQVAPGYMPFTKAISGYNALLLGDLDGALRKTGKPWSGPGRSLRRFFYRKYTGSGTRRFNERPAILASLQKKIGS